MTDRPTVGSRCPTRPEWRQAGASGRPGSQNVQSEAEAGFPNTCLALRDKQGSSPAAPLENRNSKRAGEKSLGCAPSAESTPVKTTARELLDGAAFPNIGTSFVMYRHLQRTWAEALTVECSHSLLLRRYGATQMRRQMHSTDTDKPRLIFGLY